MHKKVVGKLFATWCGHCQTLEPQWKKMREIVLKGSKEPVEFVEIESESLDSGLEELNRKYKTNVELKGGYPTLFKIESGKKQVDYYNGERDANNLAKWSLGNKGGRKKRTQKRKQQRNRTQKRR